MFIDMRLKKIAAETQLDLRNVAVEYTPDIDIDEDPEDNYYSASQRIVATNNGTEIGKIDFSHVKQEGEDGEQEELLYLAYIEVPDTYRGSGISGMLYKKFGEVYSEKYNGLPVERHFENPIAEYSFKKAIDQGWVPEAALTEERITRQYDTQEKQTLWQDLRQKLPEKLQSVITASDAEVILAIEDMGIVGSESKGMLIIDEHELQAQYKAQNIGHLRFKEHDDQAGDENKGWLEVNELVIDGQYQNMHIDEELFKKFGEIYNQEFSNWFIVLTFDDESKKSSLKQFSLIPAQAFKDSPDQIGNVEALGSMKRLIRKHADATGVQIGPIDITTGQISNRQYKIEIRRDGELLGDMKYEVYPEKNILLVNYIEIGERYRQNGLAMLIYKEFSKIYNSEYSGWRISRKFINPVAEYTFSKAVAEGLFPEETLNNIRRDYNPEDEELWYNTLEPKLKDLRRQKEQAV